MHVFLLPNELPLKIELLHERILQFSKNALLLREYQLALGHFVRRSAHCEACNGIGTRNFEGDVLLAPPEDGDLQQYHHQHH